ncbi:NAD-dependent epimerase/dehydratase family protein [Dongia sp. agr-C8]
MAGISKAIVFGGAGFIGSHLLARLARDGRYDRLYSVDIAKPRFEVAGVHYLTHDVRQPVPPDLCGAGPADIFNLAAVHTTPGHEDWEYYWTNLHGATHVCRFATETGAENIVFTSSISVYGPCEQQKDEDSPLEPNSAYGRSKLLSENVHRLWQAESGERRITIVRPAVIYGQHERGNFTRLARLLAKGRFIYPGRRDTIKACGYVEDLISSMLFMRQRNSAVVTYNFAYPDRYTTEQICAAFCKVAGYKMPRLLAPSWFMMLGAFGFEILNALGYRNTVNRPRIAKLLNSTNIMPRRLVEAGFPYGFDLGTSLQDWRAKSTATDFD